HVSRKPEPARPGGRNGDPTLDTRLRLSLLAAVSTCARRNTAMSVTLTSSVLRTERKADHGQPNKHLAHAGFRRPSVSRNRRACFSFFQARCTTSERTPDMKPTYAVALLLIAAAATACSGQNTPPAAPATVAEAPIPNTASPYDALPQAM